MLLMLLPRTHFDSPVAGRAAYTYADCPRVRIIRGVADISHYEFQGEWQERNVCEVVHGARPAKTGISEKMAQVLREKEGEIT